MAVVSISIPKYRHHKGSGQAFVQVKGKRHYLGVYGTPDSKQRYARFVAELSAAPITQAVVVPATSTVGLTVVELADAYHEFCKGYYRKKDGTPSGWLDHIKLVLEKHLSDLYGRTPAADFGPKAFKAIRQRMLDASRRGRKSSRKYINKLMPIVTRCFKWGAAEELVSASVYHSLTAVEGLRKGRTTAREPAPVLPVEETLLDATLPQMPAIVADMVRFQRLTGCRPGEVCQLRPMDLDRSGEVWQYRPDSHKTEHLGRERIICVGPQAQAVILAYLQRDSAAYCFSPIESVDAMREARLSARKTPLRRGNRKGTNRKAKPKRTPKDHYTTDSYRRAIRRSADKANKFYAEQAVELEIPMPATLSYWAPNRLRHNCATEVRKKFGLEASQVVLGHAQANTTEIYAERDSALAVEVMMKIG